MTLNFIVSIFFGTKDQKLDFEENKLNERFGECSFVYIKRPSNVKSHMYKLNFLTALINK